MQGTSKKLVDERGFGFIDIGESKDVFFHAKSCRNVDFNDLEEGQAVEIDWTDAEKGPMATSLRLV